MSSTQPLLAVRDLTVAFDTDDGLVRAVNGVSFDVYPGETLAVVGESGSGKSVTAMATMRLLPSTARITGSVEFEGRDLLALSDRDMRRIQGEDIAMIFQDPMTALNPVFTVGNQLAEAIRTHHPDVSKKAARSRSVDLLALVGIPEAGIRVDSFPHEFSGGMRQRAMIAMAIANEPKLLIADEPTTALDVTIQAQVIEVMRTAQEATGAAMMLITHDLGLVAGVAERVQVMYGGRLFETGDTDTIYYRSRNPYTRGLMSSIPNYAARTTERLEPIPGSPPSAINLPSGCAFRPRCPHAVARCRAEEPELRSLDAGGSAPVPLSLRRGAPRARHRRHGGALVTRTPDVTTNAPADGPVLELVDLYKYFPIRAGLLRRQVGNVHAVDGVSLAVDEMETLGIVGESGCGKTTLGRTLMRLYEPTSGTVRFRGEDVTGADARRLRELRKVMQMVFQDPFASLNPRMPVQDIISEPLVVHGTSRKEAHERAASLLDAVGLSPEHGNRYPHEFSGGQRQRIGIARSLALNPDVVVLDEPVSALDVSVQAQVLNLLEDLQEQFRLTYLFIAHDLSVVRHISDRVAVMYLGQVVELAAREDLYERPAHPYSHSLLSAVPVPDPETERRRERIILEGDLPSPANPPSGCRFHTRCPIVQDRCRTEVPELRVVGDGHVASCHYALEPGESLVERVRELGREVQIARSSSESAAP